MKRETDRKGKSREFPSIVHVGRHSMRNSVLVQLKPRKGIMPPTHLCLMYFRPDFYMEISAVLVSSNHKLIIIGKGSIIPASDPTNLVFTLLNTNFARTIEHSYSLTPAKNMGLQSPLLLGAFYKTQSFHSGSRALACAVIEKKVPIVKKMTLILLKLENQNKKTVWKNIITTESFKNDAKRLKNVKWRGNSSFLDIWIFFTSISFRWSTNVYWTPSTCMLLYYVREWSETNQGPTLFGRKC